MTHHVVNGALLRCSFGAAPAALSVLPVNRTLSNSQPAATIMDHAPLVNIMSFGVCFTPTNPQVAAATAAALGVLTPQPCIPVTTTPWVPGSPTVLLNGQPALNNACTCMCMWGGAITVMQPGQLTEFVP